MKIKDRNNERKREEIRNMAKLRMRKRAEFKIFH